MAQIEILTAGHENGNGLFVAFPDVSNDISKLQAARPQLRKEFAQRWPVQAVDIRYRFPNPSPGVVAALIPVATGIAVTFLTTASVYGGREFGKDVGKQMAKIVHLWLKHLEPSKRKTARQQKPNAKRKQTDANKKRR